MAVAVAVVAVVVVVVAAVVGNQTWAAAVTIVTTYSNHCL